MRVWRKLPIAAVGLLIAGLLVYGFWPAPVKVDTARAIRGRLLVTVRDDGETRIREKYTVSAPVEGRLQRIELHSGDAVHQGRTVLARLDPGDPALLDARAKAQAEARVRSAEATRLQSQSLLAQRQEGRELAEHEFERAAQLIKSRSISASEFDRAEHQLRIAQSEVHSAAFANKIADFELELAQAALIRTEGNSTSDSPSAIVIHSPIDGCVLRVFREDAGVTSPGDPLLELGDPHDLELKVDLLSTDAVRIQPGAQVFVEHWGGPGILEGSVRLIEPYAFVKVSALGVEEKRVNVIADFVSPYEQRRVLGDGYRIEARIVVSDLADVLKIPSGALVHDGDQLSVYRVNRGVAQRRTVQIGAANELETEVRGGIEEGDLLILYPTDKVSEGVHVVD